MEPHLTEKMRAKRRSDAKKDVGYKIELNDLSEDLFESHPQLLAAEIAHRRAQTRREGEETRLIRLTRFRDRMKTVRDLSLTALIVPISIGVGIVLWSALRSKSIVAEPFQVPPSLAEEGLSGTVVASRLVDQLQALQTKVQTLRAADEYRANRGETLKVEIPQTGISVGEALRQLRRSVGRETVVSGEVVKTAAGLSVTARAGAKYGRTFTGPKDQLDQLLAKSAEGLLEDTQPFQYAAYINVKDEVPSADKLKAWRRAAETGPAADRPWALAEWSYALTVVGDYESALEKAKAAVALDRDLALGHWYLWSTNDVLGRSEASYDAATAAAAALKKRGGSGLAKDRAAAIGRWIPGAIASLQGDFQGASRHFAAAGDGTWGDYRTNIEFERALSLALNHEAGRALGIIRRYPDAEEVRGATAMALLRMAASASVDDNAAVLAALAATDKAIAPKSDYDRGEITERSNWLLPYAAVALARLGRAPEAEAMISATSLSCYPCVRARAKIAAIRGEHARADRWFGEAVKMAPKLPFAHAEWGEALLARNLPADAIAKAKAAHRLGPRWADPLALWAQALEEQGDRQGALEKFAAAGRLAPRWGGLHLRWGQALLGSGRREDAADRLAAASHMDLSPSDRAAMDRLLAARAAAK